MTPPRIALGPGTTRRWLTDAIEAGGARLVELGEAEALVWAAPDAADELDDVLEQHPGIGWVQLPFAGIEPYAELVGRHADRTWTCGKGVYAEPVAELALALLLAGFRGLATYARATSWGGPLGRNLGGARVVVAGGGGITESFLRLLGPFGCAATVVRRTPGPVPGAAVVVGVDRLDEVLDGADALVLALALTPETTGLVDRRRLDLLAEGAWVVNVARGLHVVTDDLVAALRAGGLGGAGLDVTDPEPLPDGHPLWAMPNVLLTPHVGNTPDMAVPLLSARVADNIARYAAGEALIGPVDPAAGY
ncbi:MAG: hydroxyacid dehydrogenase [Acidimicrobiia bacterium]|nr:hydroxyacid dehydrogenase [Acidimicrobiia bacterium]